MGTYDYIIWVESVRLTLEPLWVESFAVDESSIGTSNIFDADLPK